MSINTSLPRYELSNSAFLTSTAILMGTPVPHKRPFSLKQSSRPEYKSTRPEYTHIDPCADMLPNDAARASTSHYASHNAIVIVLAEQATNYGVGTTAELRRDRSPGRTIYSLPLDCSLSPLHPWAIGPDKLAPLPPPSFVNVVRHAPLPPALSASPRASPFPPPTPHPLPPNSFRLMLIKV